MIKDYWEKVLNYSDYSKGAEYSASDLTNPVLICKLRKKHPKVDDVATKDKVSAWIGSAIHTRCEVGIVPYVSEEDLDDRIKTEVRMKLRNLSGTADIVNECQDGFHIGDVKTGKEANIIKKIKDSTDWIVQLSVYRYLATKDLKIDVSLDAEIYWLSVDTGKYGIHSIKLMDSKETVQYIKNFMETMKTPIQDEPQCEGCVGWRHRWCGVRTVCPHWGLREQSTTIDDWDS